MPGHPHFRQASRTLEDAAPSARRRVEAALRPYIVDAPPRRAALAQEGVKAGKRPDGLLRLPPRGRD